MTKWVKRWPRQPGLYWFYGYPINEKVDVFPRLLLVNVEYHGNFGVRARTFRMSLSRQTGCAGLWRLIDQPFLPDKEDIPPFKGGGEDRQ